MDDLHGFTHLQCPFYHRNKSTNSGIYQHFPGIFRDLNRKHEVFTVGSVGGSLFLDKLENWGIQAKWILTNKTILVCIGISEKLGAAKSSKLLVMFNRKLMVKRHTSDYFPSILYLVGALEHLFFFSIPLGILYHSNWRTKKWGRLNMGPRDHTGMGHQMESHGDADSEPIGSMYIIYIYGNIYHQYTPNVSIYTSTMDPSWGREANETGGLMRWRASCFLPLLDVAGWIWLDHDFSDQRWPKKVWELTMVDYDELWYRTWFRLITDWLENFIEVTIWGHKMM